MANTQKKNIGSNRTGTVAIRTAKIAAMPVAMRIGMSAFIGHLGLKFLVGEMVSTPARKRKIIRRPARSNRAAVFPLRTTVNQGCAGQCTGFAKQLQGRCRRELSASTKPLMRLRVQPIAPTCRRLPSEENARCTNNRRRRSCSSPRPFVTRPVFCTAFVLPLKEPP
jgi:hypothetical protein